MPEISYVSVFLVGLLGGVHCVGMCGGIVTALSLSSTTRRPALPMLLAYNFGRITSYALAGAIVGAIGASTLLLERFVPAERVLYGVANIMLILLGLYLAGLSRAVLALERVGSVVWARLQPLMKRFIPVRTLPQAFFTGAVWGWLPCGLVYSVLISALATASAAHGALLMLAFGAGTLPNLLAMGLFAQRLQTLTRKPGVRLAAGLLVAAFGVWGLTRLILYV
ncbi:heavy-metal-associated domain (N-terminus) and membrane-bounded cytochrome biogenesis cycZ-like domain, possible membrane copper tolerance protein [Sulfuriferula multivorans]|uniref:Heavy-metal-associated domain (N-terminus) and membrane-bounded cytochrome biogenesis cycZ-like domain, possible membrane copper tolerance protein n=1 Tax=Sulfuriferula multivorans TaxID=1559896 RepID=A0A401JDM3_9PROT|nr:sulfite exporter TauE/SafE family protein [Sulfuriferula multivorans]GBL45667.1 heavy-metal-associated domain (N-terminus) and membrane-bounded cytochrome biogenesis cycZ-like domain, possible membrane copper tolerance protein [Sulfuriferula multivorans]